MTIDKLNSLIRLGIAKRVPNFSMYYATRYGRIISIYNHNGTDCRYLKRNINKNGYDECILYDINGNRVSMLSHRVVASTFIENRHDLPFINHKDEVKSNNFVGNLEWCTRAYNNNYGTRSKRASESLINGKHCKEVAQIDKIGNIVKIWHSARLAHREEGYSYKNISACCNGTKLTHLGYYWRFTNDLNDNQLESMMVDCIDSIVRQSKKIEL